MEQLTVQQQDLQLAEIYQSVFPPLCKYVGRKGGSLDEAKDVFHDALLIYCEKHCSPTEITDDNAYVFGIARHLWHKKYKEKQRQVTLDDAALSLTSDSEENVSSTLLLFLKETGSKCMELLQSFYYENQNAEKIAARFGYSSVRSATVQKFKCLEKVRDLVKSKALHYEDFLE